MTDKPNLRRRWLQFSLRTLMLVVTVFCIWLGITAKRARDQKEVVVALRNLNVRVTYDYQVEASRLHFARTNKPAPWPTWLCDLFGIDFFANVVATGHYDNVIHNAGLDQVGRLPHLMAVYYNGVGMDDRGLRILSSTSGLENLAVRNSQITDAGLVHLKGLTSLIRLYLSNTKITDRGLEQLKGLTHLRTLDLTNTQVTGAGLVHLKGLTELQLLDLAYTQITDAGLEHLKEMKQLEILHIKGTKITKRGIQELRQALPPNCQIVY